MHCGTLTGAFTWTDHVKVRPQMQVTFRSRTTHGFKSALSCAFILPKISFLDLQYPSIIPRIRCKKWFIMLYCFHMRFYYNCGYCDWNTNCFLYVLFIYVIYIYFVLIYILFSKTPVTKTWICTSIFTTEIDTFYLTSCIWSIYINLLFYIN